MDSTTMLIKSLHDQRLLLDYFYVTAAAVVIYDYLLTLHLEIKYIWSSRWSYTKVLFLLNRYVAFVSTSVILYDQVFLDVSAEVCKTTWPLSVWLMVFRTVVATTILCVRTWAIWGKDRRVGIGLVAIMLAYVALQCVVVTRFLRSFQFSPPPYWGFRGCLFISASRQVWAQYASIFGVDALVLTLMIISAFRFYREGSKTELSFIIHRDGIQFYVYLLCLSGANSIMALAAPITLIALLVPLENAMHSVFTARIILNIRTAANHGQDTELHSCYNGSDIQPLSSELRFAPMEYPQNLIVSIDLQHGDRGGQGYSSVYVAGTT